MTKKPTAARQEADLRKLLDVVRQALTIPFDTFDYDRRIFDRATHARTALTAVATETDVDLPWEINYLQRQLAAEEQTAAEREAAHCRRCHTPFDPSDPRFDGHARYKDTTWCQACIDNCHEGSAEHVCLICEPSRYGGEQQ
ncbi:hypothetical protein ABZ608_41510 [Streptomyces sp. NPDC013172]|uniref:Uncharacterized protein n=1 Tax=Streptomyces atriruber TaxID=545121 RepID=A0ABV3C133_9ACTN